MKKSLWIVVVMVIALSTYSSVQAKNPFKPKIGQVRTFTVTPTVGEPWEKQDTVTGKANIKCMGKSYYILESTGTSSPDDYDMYMARATKDTLYTYYGLCTEDAPYRFGPVGTTWTYEGGNFDRTIEAIETVTVPAGTFENCLRIRQRDLHSCPSPVDDILEWFSLDGLGTVKEIRYDNGSCIPIPERTIELKSYTR